jgi:hypothetical protein
MQATLSIPTGLTTLGELHDALRAEDNADSLVRASSVHMADDGRLHVSYSGTYDLDSWALKQIGGRLGIPGDYLAKCPAPLRAINVNHWLTEYTSEKGRDRQLLLRHHGRDGSIRAILTDKYSAVDDVQVVDHAVSSFGADTPARMHRDATHSRIEILGRTEVGERNGASGLRAGVNIRNSEVGAAALMLEGLIYRALCANGLIMGSAQMSVRRAHLGGPNEILNEFTGLMARASGAMDVVRAGLDAAQTIVVPFAQVPSIVDAVVARHELTQGQRSAVLAAFEAERGETLYHVMQGFTRAGSHAVGLAEDARMQLSRIGGSILERVNSGERAWLARN